MFRKIILCACLVIAFVSGSAFSAIVYNQWSGGAGTTDWNTAGNWALGYVPNIYAPDGIDNVKAGFKTATGPILGPETTNAAAYQITLGGVAGGILTLSGGTLYIDQYVAMGVSNYENGTLAMNSGTFTVGTNYLVGQTGTGTINMNGGNINITGNLSIADTAGSTGTVNLYGGTITAGTLLMDRSTGGNARLNMAGGTLILDGDEVSNIDGFISGGLLVAYDGVGTVIRDYDVTNAGKTTITGNFTTEQAHLPVPSSGSVDLYPKVILHWTPGTSAVLHDIYFGTDANSVLLADTSSAGIYQGTQLRDANSFVLSGIQLSKTYYWRVDEVNDFTTTKGNVWQFTIADYALIDDFEKYFDSAAMQAAWSNNSTAAVLSLSTTDGHDKAKTLKLDYNNANTPLYSEAQISGIDPNWMVAGVKAIDIWYKGNAANAAEPMYAALEDNDGHPVAVIQNANPAAAQAADWQVWRIRLADFAPANLVNVKKFCLGFGNRTNPAAGGSGTVYFDDIRLWPTRCLTKLSTDFNNDCVVDFKDLAIFAENWTN